MREHKHMRELAIVLSIALLFMVVLFTKLYIDNNKQKESSDAKLVELKDIQIEIPKDKPSSEEVENEVNLEEETEKETNFSIMYATTNLNIRTGASADSEIYDTVLTNTKLNIADNFDINGWKMVEYDGRELYVNGKYLSDSPVEIKKVEKPSSVTKEITKEITKEKHNEDDSNTTKDKQKDVVQNNSKNTSSNKLIGKFKITHYAEDNITATGVVPKVGRTIAVDPNVIPYGSRVVINGHTYIAEDCGGAINGNVIDIYVNSTEEAYQKGVYYTEVYWG